MDGVHQLPWVIKQSKNTQNVLTLHFAFLFCLPLTTENVVFTLSAERQHLAGHSYSLHVQQIITHHDSFSFI